MTVRWLTTFLDRPASSFDATVAFWTAVTGTTLSAARGEHGEFATLVPPDGDAYLRMQRVAAGPGGSHLDLHTDDIVALAETAERLGASVEQRLDDVVVLRSPAGLLFCSVRHRGEAVRPTTGVVDQVCIDVPPDEYEQECAFWAALTGWEHRPAMLPEYSYLVCPEPIARASCSSASATALSPPTSTSAAMTSTASTAGHVALGATVVAHHEWWTTLRDPAGVPYCLIRRRLLTHAARRSTSAFSSGPNHGPSPAAALSTIRCGLVVAGIDTLVAGWLSPYLSNACDQLDTPNSASGASSDADGLRPTRPPAANGRIRMTPIPSSCASGKMRRSTSRSTGLYGTWMARDATRPHHRLQLVERRRLPVGRGDDADLAPVAPRLDLVEARAPLHEVVHLEHLDVAAEVAQRGVDLSLRLVVVGRPHLGGDDGLAAPVAERGAEDALGVAVHRRRVDERRPVVQRRIGDLLPGLVDVLDVERLRRAHPDDGDLDAGERTMFHHDPTRLTNSVMRATKASRW